MDKQPEILSINVSENVSVGEIFGQLKTKIFINPKNDPNIAGLTQVSDMEVLKKIAPLAFDYSKETGKPVIIVVKAK